MKTQQKKHYKKDMKETHTSPLPVVYTMPLSASFTRPPTPATGTLNMTNGLHQHGDQQDTTRVFGEEPHTKTDRFPSHYLHYSPPSRLCSTFLPTIFFLLRFYSVFLRFRLPACVSSNNSITTY